MVRRCLCYGNDVNNNNGDDDDVKIYVYKILKEIMYLEVTMSRNVLKSLFVISYIVGSYF